MCPWESVRVEAAPMCTGSSLCGRLPRQRLRTSSSQGVEEAASPPRHCMRALDRNVEVVLGSEGGARDQPHP